MPASPTALSDTDLARLEALLDALPPPLEPLDLAALDGYLCGVLLQPRPVSAAQWQRRIADAEGREPKGVDVTELLALVTRRHAELRRAIAAREWFDPWITDLDEGAGSVRDSVLPWVAGFALAMEVFHDLLSEGGRSLLEPIALLYLHFDPDDLEAEPELLECIEAIEPPADMTEAVEDLVRAVLLLADAAQPRPARRTPPPARRAAAGRPRRRG